MIRGNRVRIAVVAVVMIFLGESWTPHEWAQRIARSLNSSESLVQDQQPGRTGRVQPADVVARCQGFALTAGDVDWQIATTLTWDGLDELGGAAARAQTIELTIDRWLIANLLKNGPTWIGPSQLRMQIEAEKRKCQSAGLDLQQVLKERGISEGFWQFDLEWKTAWPRHLLETYPTEKLQEIFEARRADFDGTEVMVAQILLKDLDSAAFDRARQIKARVERQELTFEEAAKEYSIAPSSQLGGNLGWVSRWGPMPENYSAVAFRLAPGEISEPVTTIYGVHLIKCLEIKPGGRSFRDAVEEMRQVLAQEEFKKLRDQAREAGVSVEYSDTFPHFNENGVLVLPK